MSNPLAQAHDHPVGSDRRLYYRQPIRTLAYVELDEGNGGIVLNVSEGGLSVQAFASLMDDVLPGVRFQLSESDGWIQANARITWTGQSRKLAGLAETGAVSGLSVPLCDAKALIFPRSLPSFPCPAAHPAASEPMARSSRTAAAAQRSEIGLSAL